MRLLFSSQIAPEVELLRGLLDEAGIATEVRNESIYPNLPGAAFQPETWVLNDSDFERACEVRDAWHQPVPGADAEPAQGREPDAGGLTFVGLLLLTACVGFAWLAVRSGNWVVFGLLFAFFGPLGVLCLWLARQAQTKKQKQKQKSP